MIKKFNLVLETNAELEGAETAICLKTLWEGTYLQEVLNLLQEVEDTWEILQRT